MSRHEDFLQFMQDFDMTKLNAATIQEAERYNAKIFEDRDCSSEWRPSPSCKVLFENVPLWCVPRTSTDEIGLAKCL